MPRVSVILKDGTEIKVEGANDAAWAKERLMEGVGEPITMLIVYHKELNKTEVRGRFYSLDVIGYTIDPA